MKLVIDSIEDNIAVLISDNGEYLSVSADLLPDSSSEGCVVESRNGIFYLCEKDTADKRAKIFSKQSQIFNRNEKKKN